MLYQKWAFLYISENVCRLFATTANADFYFMFFSVHVFVVRNNFCTTSQIMYCYIKTVFLLVKI